MRLWHRFSRCLWSQSLFFACRFSSASFFRMPQFYSWQVDFLRRTAHFWLGDVSKIDSGNSIFQVAFCRFRQFSLGLRLPPPSVPVTVCSRFRWWVGLCFLFVCLYPHCWGCAFGASQGRLAFWAGRPADSGTGGPPSESSTDSGPVGSVSGAGVSTQSRTLDTGIGLTLGDVQVVASFLLVGEFGSLRWWLAVFGRSSLRFRYGLAALWIVPWLWSPWWDWTLAQMFHPVQDAGCGNWPDPWRRPSVLDSAWLKVLSSGGALPVFVTSWHIEVDYSCSSCAGARNSSISYSPVGLEILLVPLGHPRDRGLCLA